MAKISKLVAISLLPLALLVSCSTPESEPAVFTDPQFVTVLHDENDSILRRICDGDHLVYIYHSHLNGGAGVSVIEDGCKRE